MSDFWAKKLAQAAPPQQAPVQPVNDRAWWRPPTLPQTPQAATQAVPQPVQQQSDGTTNIAVLLGQDNYTTTKARSAMSTDSCPACGSGNYMGFGRAAKRCFECGYNPLFEQSGAGISANDPSKPTFVSRGQQANVNDFNPRQIIGHV